MDMTPALPTLSSHWASTRNDLVSAKEASRGHLKFFLSNEILELVSLAADDAQSMGTGVVGAKVRCENQTEYALPRPGSRRRVAGRKAGWCVLRRGSP